MWHSSLAHQKNKFTMNYLKQMPAVLLIAAASLSACKQNDAELKTNVATAVENDKVDVDVNDGVVTLSGEVRTPAVKAKAEANARKVSGVHDVNNEITVVIPDAPPPPAKDLRDQKLNNEVQAVIVPFPDVRASVNDGVVTLSGSISRTGLALLMPKIAGLFPRKIDNNLVIRK
jgi:hypothetical protein